MKHIQNNFWRLVLCGVAALCLSQGLAKSSAGLGGDTNPVTVGACDGDPETPAPPCS
jgi:hypothetical protein